MRFQGAGCEDGDCLPGFYNCSWGAAHPWGWRGLGRAVLCPAVLWVQHEEEEEEELWCGLRCQQPVCGDTGEPGWEQGVTGACHPFCVLWHCDSALLRGCWDPKVVTRATPPALLHLPCAKASALGQDWGCCHQTGSCSWGCLAQGTQSLWRDLPLSLQGKC